jgi:hypothetical protein
MIADLCKCLYYSKSSIQAKKMFAEKIKTLNRKNKKS